MASQAERYRKAIEEYKKRPIYNPKVLAQMNLQLQYANTIDPEVSKEASRLLEAA